MNIILLLFVSKAEQDKILKKRKSIKMILTTSLGLVMISSLGLGLGLGFNSQLIKKPKAKQRLEKKLIFFKVLIHPTQA